MSMIPLHKVEVDMGKVKAADESMLLYTKKLGTCIGIAIYDSNRNLGVLGHIRGYNVKLLDNVLGNTRMLQEEGSLSDTLTGRLILPSMTLDKEALEDMKEMKEGCIPEIVERYSGVVNLDVHTCKPEYGVKLLTLAPKNGRIFMREWTDPVFLGMWGT